MPAQADREETQNGTFSLEQSNPGHAGEG